MSGRSGQTPDVSEVGPKVARVMVQHKALLDNHLGQQPSVCARVTRVVDGYRMVALGNIDRPPASVSSERCLPGPTIPDHAGATKSARRRRFRACGDCPSPPQSPDRRFGQLRWRIGRWPPERPSDAQPGRRARLASKTTVVIGRFGRSFPPSPGFGPASGGGAVEVAGLEGLDQGPGPLTVCDQPSEPSDDKCRFGHKSL